MNAKIKTLVGIAALALIIATAALIYNSRGKEAGLLNDLNPAAGRMENAAASQDTKTKAPDFTVSDGKGNSVKLSDMAGKPVVLNFWASWCPPCKIEMPDFNKIYKETGNEIQFMMVDLVDGQRETVETGARYVREQGFSFPVYFDTRQEGAYAYGIRSIPTTFFIDKDGYIVTGAQGAINEEILRRGIELIR